jgi:outer membrane lipoprotein SlyB
MFKKSIIFILMMFVLAIMLPLATATDASAQTRRVRHRTTSRYYYKRPNFYRRHRKAINIGAGTAGGALVGGLIGGRKGALIGGGAGAVTGAVVTHKQRPKNHYTRRRVRRTYRNP